MILDWIYPPRCIACRTLFSPFHGRSRPWLCDECRCLFEAISEAYCSRCGSPVKGQNICDICHNCRGRHFYFASHRAAFIYEETLRDLMHHIKFRSQRQLAQGLGELFAEVAAEWDHLVKVKKAAYIVPIPLHPSKKRMRGFNQAEVMARPLSKALNIPIAADMLKRVRKTAPQSGLSAASREQNLEEAFRYNKKYGDSPACILLLDDIYTSGATMNACAKTLMENNTQEIHAISLSIAVKDSSLG